MAGFIIVRREIGAFGELVEKTAIGRDIATREDAEREAIRLASEHESHGHNPEHGFWWFRRDGKLYRLTVE
jgi:hypothetical protein